MTKRQWQTVVTSLVSLLVLLSLVTILACAPAPTTPTPTPTPTPKTSPTPTPTPTPKLPSLISMTTTAVGSEAYTFSMGLSEGIEKKSGIKVRVEGLGSEIGRITPLKDKQTELAILHTSLGVYLTRGMYQFADWGPQKLRLVVRGSYLWLVEFARGDSGIKTTADMKGKRLTWVEGGYSQIETHDAYLAYAGLTWNDVKKVSVPTLVASYKAPLEGIADLANGASFAADVMELANSRYGISYMPLPQANKEAWARAQAVAPSYVPTIMTGLPGMKAGETLEAGTTIYTMTGYDFLDEQLVYTVAKAVWEGYDIFKGQHPKAAEWSPQNATDVLGIPWPAHPGLVRLLKEKGVWTAQHEAWQQAQLKAEQERLAAWAAKKK